MNNRELVWNTFSAYFLAFLQNCPPSIRVGQALFNFVTWVQNNKCIDLFSIDDTMFETLFIEYFGREDV